MYIYMYNIYIYVLNYNVCLVCQFVNPYEIFAGAIPMFDDVELCPQ